MLSFKATLAYIGIATCLAYTDYATTAKIKDINRDDITTDRSKDYTKWASPPLEIPGT